MMPPRNDLCPCRSGRKFKVCCRPVRQHEYPFRGGHVLVIELAHGGALWAVKYGAIGGRGSSPMVGWAGAHARTAIRKLEAEARAMKGAAA